MAQESPDQALPEDLLAPSDPRSPAESAAAAAEPSLSRSSSGSSRLNARAPEFVPRTNHPGPGRADHHQQHQHHHHHPRQHHLNHHPQQQQPLPPRMVPIHHHHGPPPPQVIHFIHPHAGPAAFHAPPVVPSHGPPSFEYYGTGGFVEHEASHVPTADADPAPEQGECDALPDEVIHKVTKQVEYYFSDVNLATTEHLMRFISKDPEGFVPLSVLAPFKKIRALVNNSAQLAAALQTSTKLVVSEDGKKVKRLQPITGSDLEELQSRIVVAENLPEDHCYQNLVKVFSVVGSVKTIRTCYPQNTNGAAPTNSRPGKMDTFLYNKLHAFVEYETVEQAEKAVAELNDEGNWRSGLRVRLLPKCMRHGYSRGRKGGQEGDGNAEDEDFQTSNQQHEGHPEDHSQLNETSNEHTGEEGHHDRDGVARRGRGRGRGGKGRGRGQYHNNNRNSGHPIGTPPSTHQAQIELPAIAKQPPGPRMPDGTRGFTIGRGKPLGTTISAS